MSSFPIFSLPPAVLPVSTPDVSVLVPVTKGAEALEQLYEEYAAPFRAASTTFEFLFLVEPWAYRLIHPLLPLMERGEPIRIVEVGQTLTESALLQTGAHHARARIVLTLPTAWRVEPASLLDLVSAVGKGADVVIARRWPRYDSWFRQLHNRVSYWLTPRLGGNGVRDTACGVRAMPRELLQNLPLYGDFHRYLPLFALREGYRIREIDAPQHPKDVSSGPFSPGIYLRRLVDLLGLYFLLHFTERPLRFFGLTGSVVTGAGALLLMILFVERLGGEPLADRPLLVLSVMLLVLGFQSIALGLIGEIVVHLHAPARRPYRLAHPDPQVEVVHGPDTELERVSSRQ